MPFSRSYFLAHLFCITKSPCITVCYFSFNSFSVRSLCCFCLSGRCDGGIFQCFRYNEREQSTHIMFAAAAVDIRHYTFSKHVFGFPVTLLFFSFHSYHYFKCFAHNSTILRYALGRHFVYGLFLCFSSETHGLEN